MLPQVRRATWPKWASSHLRESTPLAADNNVGEGPEGDDEIGGEERSAGAIDVAKALWARTDGVNWECGWMGGLGWGGCGMNPHV